MPRQVVDTLSCVSPICTYLNTEDPNPNFLPFSAFSAHFSDAMAVTFTNLGGDAKLVVQLHPMSLSLNTVATLPALVVSVS